jgi:hypothetical protein
VNVFFVCGAPKSGTTWLQRVLDAHPEVMCSGEGHFIDRVTQPLAKIINDYNSQLSLIADRVYEGRPSYGLTSQLEYDTLARTFIMGRLTSRGPDSRVAWVGDKTPRYSLVLEALWRLFPQARFINIVRDPRDTAMSLLGHGVRAGMADVMEPESESRRTLLQGGVKDWVANVTPIADFDRKHPGQMHRLRYEDMLADPAGEARRVFSFLGVETGEAVISRVVKTTSFEAQSGRKNGEEQLGAFLRKGVAGDWVGRLDPWAVRLVEETCGDLMRENGYL